MGKVDNGIVCFVNAYGVYNNITFTLLFKVFKPQGTLKAEYKYQTKIELATKIITQLIELGFNIESLVEYLPRHFLHQLPQILLLIKFLNKLFRANFSSSITKTFVINTQVSFCSIVPGRVTLKVVPFPLLLSQSILPF